MPSFPGLSFADLVSEDGDTLLYQATRTEDGTPVLLKISASARPAPLLQHRLEREFELARDLDSSRILRPIALSRHAEGLVLELDSGPDRTLASMLGTPMGMSTFIPIAIGITEALSELHRHELVHKDLKPENVLMDAGGHVWVTGLGMASRLLRERQAPEPPEMLAGTLAYMAPEQTGRMNRSIDSRSDLYALGVIFYRMLTGALPFIANDPMEWVHCHIARQPVPPRQRMPGLPEPLSAMVMKLLAKNAEDRYQSTVGLDADLRRCLAQWESDGRIEHFPLGEHDLSEHFLIPEKLYGRQAEIDVLLAAFDRMVATGQPELVLVSGYSGVGKTALVNELHKPLVPPRGIYAAGKFDQYKRDIPYATLVQALQTLVRQILAKSEAEVEKWREALQKSVTPNGALIIGLIPEVELIIGPQPPVPDLPPQEAQNRFQMVLLQFLGAFADADHPLALFLDDLQWLDAATLALLEQLATGKEVRHLLLIGAYRDNEVGPAHPLTRIIETIRKHGIGMHEFVLAPLSIGDVSSLVADALQCTPAHARPLGALVHEKTGGNPFFTIQFLTALIDEKLLAFDPSAGGWTWDLSRIHAKGFTDNVVDLMVQKLVDLPESTLEALKQFACLGNVADITTLTTVSGQSEEALHKALWEAVRAGLVFRQEKTYAFLHDRVQEAAYSLIPEARRKELHLKMGRLLLAQYPQEASAERVFDVVDQFNRSVELVMDDEERATLRRLNTAAGRKARGAVAYASGRRYLEQAMVLLPADCWSKCYADSLALYRELAECEYLVGNFQHADELLTVALEKAHGTLDLASIHHLRLRLYEVSGRYREALEIALEALRLFGVVLPEADDDIQMATEIELRLVSENMCGRRIHDLLDTPPAIDDETRHLIGLLADAMPLVYIVRTGAYVLFTAKAVNICLQRGHGDGASFLYSAHAMALAGDIRNILTAQQFSEMAIELNAQTPGAGPVRGKGLFLHAITINVWRHHIATNLPLIEQSFHASLDFGDLVYGGFTTMHAIWAHLENGAPLERVVEVARCNVARAQEIHNGVAYHLDRLEQQFALSLQGKTRSLTDFNDAAFDEASSVAAIEQSGFQHGFAFYLIMKQIPAFIAERFDEALEWANRAAPMLPNVRSTVNEATHYFYRALTLAALHAQDSAEQQRQFAQTITEILGKLKLWAENCPENFANRYFLVSAEIARIEGRDMEAMRLYDEAICSSRDNNFVHQEALACEVASRFYRARGFDRIADAYLRDACACYARWGAQGKVRQLEQRHPQLREAPSPAPVGTPSTLAGEIDALAIVQAARAISSEILLDNLIETLMRTVLTAAGARQGCLLLNRNEELTLAAEAHVENQNVVVQVRGEPALAETLFPASIVNYVRRSQDTVLLDDTTRSNPYLADAYFSRRHPESVLCFPITKQSKLIGLVYLENDLATQVFTSDRLAVLELLAAQSAIALENALVYEALRESEQKFRAIFDQTFQFIGVLSGDGVLLQANQTALQFAGVDEDKVLGKLFWETTWWAHSPELQQQLKTAVREAAQGELVRFEATHVGSKGQISYVDFSLKPITDAQGRVVLLIPEGRDITERKLAEEALRQLNTELDLRVATRTAELQEANKELESFSFSVSHDLRAPLRHIEGYLTQLKESAAAKLDADELRHIETIARATRRMGMLIDDLLSFSRMGRQEMSKTPVDLRALVADIVQDMVPETKGRDVEWHIAELPMVVGDKAMLRIVLTNLISNALKFTQKREKAEITIGCQSNQSAETVVFVRDNGAGFDMRYKDKLFGVFQRLHRFEDFQGTGIGLANVFRIVARHGGRAWAEGAVDFGATFYFSLPQDNA